MADVSTRNTARCPGPIPTQTGAPTAISTLDLASTRNVELAHNLKGCGARRLMAVIRFRGTSTEMVRQTQHLFSTEVAPKLLNLKT